MALFGKKKVKKGPQNTQYKSNAAGKAAMMKKVASESIPPSQVTGSGIPMKDRAATIQRRIQRHEPITDADLLSKTEYVTKQRGGVKRPEDLAKKVATAKKKYASTQKKK